MPRFGLANGQFLFPLFPQTGGICGQVLPIADTVPLSANTTTPLVFMRVLLDISMAPEATIATSNAVGAFSILKPDTLEPDAPTMVADVKTPTVVISEPVPVMMVEVVPLSPLLGTSPISIWPGCSTRGNISVFALL